MHWFNWFLPIVLWIQYINAAHSITAVLVSKIEMIDQPVAMTPVMSPSQFVTLPMASGGIDVSPIMSPDLATCMSPGTFVVCKSESTCYTGINSYIGCCASTSQCYAQTTTTSSCPANRPVVARLTYSTQGFFFYSCFPVSFIDDGGSVIEIDTTNNLPPSQSPAPFAPASAIATPTSSASSETPESTASTPQQGSSVSQPSSTQVHSDSFTPTPTNSIGQSGTTTGSQVGAEATGSGFITTTSRIESGTSSQIESRTRSRIESGTSSDPGESGATRGGEPGSTIESTTGTTATPSRSAVATATSGSTNISTFSKNLPFAIAAAIAAVVIIIMVSFGLTKRKLCKSWVVAIKNRIVESWRSLVSRNRYPIPETPNGDEEARPVDYPFGLTTVNANDPNSYVSPIEMQRLERIDRIEAERKRKEEQEQGVQQLYGMPMTSPGVFASQINGNGTPAWTPPVTEAMLYANPSSRWVESTTEEWSTSRVPRNTQAGPVTMPQRTATNPFRRANPNGLHVSNSEAELRPSPSMNDTSFNDTSFYSNADHTLPTEDSFADLLHGPRND